MPPNSGNGGAGGAPSELQVFPTEASLPEGYIAIDGEVYDLKGFDHPGGDSINLFGGNDVSVQYRMIHPFHAGKGAVSKMRKVGRLAKPARMDYTFGSEFEKDLIASVAKVVKPSQRFATFGFWFRCAFYVSLYALLTYFYVSQGSSITLCILIGMSQASIGLNVQHDANHGAVSPTAFWNDFLGFGADMIGGCKYLWLQQHWTHHAFTNDITRDPDASSTDPFFLFHDYDKNSATRKAMHVFQHFYMIPVLAMYWASSIFNTNVVTLQHTGAADAGMKFANQYRESQRPISVLLRSLYLGLYCATPFYYHSWPTALAHVWLMAVSESLTLAIPFALSHNFLDSERHPVANGKTCWYKSQVETSSTYGGHIAGYLTGGLNFQIEHHLFPRMSSAWYPYIQPTVREVCKRHGVNYVYYPNIFSNLYSTFSYIAQVGSGSYERKVKAN
eukprot:CAMPEP_0173468700 /NCGR_PEP_ID=MMETSP1357-20121228/76986_1 /TAXON_ID=77926 /ORGANISM="Hemiselmis rufescens, Strain PCC563" /LENGTH=445 /DNA_ID=CAMNT_0014436925 /DNA_START=41 /DNA_END=1378 /DNA_ORIENTATION=-